MKIHTTLLATTLLVAIYGTAQKRQLPISVVDATKQHWVSGAPGGRQGFNYSIKIFIRTERKVEFRNLWLGKVNLPFNVEFFDPDIPQKIKQDDTVLLTTVMVNNETNTEEGAKRLPVEYKGEALFETTIDGRVRYFIVKNFRLVQELKAR